MPFDQETRPGFDVAAFDRMVKHFNGPIEPAETYFKPSEQKKLSAQNILWPAPVYEALFDDGKIIRMSFAVDRTKPINPERISLLCRQLHNAEFVAGFVEHESLGGEPVPHERLIKQSSGKPTRKQKTCTCPNCGTKF